MLDKSLEVFWKAKSDPNYASTLSNELGELHNLCWNFVQSAKTQKTQDRQKALHEKMGQSVDKARATLREYKSGQDWTLAQSEVLEQSFKHIYETLQGHMNESESEVATSIAKNCNLLITAVTDMREKQKTHTWESLIHNVDTVYPVVERSLKNRITVTQDPDDKATLEDATAEIAANMDPMRRSCQAYRNGNGSEMEVNKHCNAIIFATQRVVDVLSRFIIGDAMYKHHGIEPEAFNETLDDLINSINRGDGSGIRGAAQDLADRVRDMERRKALADASKALKDQTKELLAASQDALKNKDSEDAKNRLNNLVASMKANVADLAAQEEAAARRKAELLRTAGGLGRAVDSMASAANAFRGGHTAPVLDQHEIDRQEREKDDKLAKRQADHDAGRGNSNNNNNNNAGKGTDKELDDLLSGLDSL